MIKSLNFEGQSISKTFNLEKSHNIHGYRTTAAYPCNSIIFLFSLLFKFQFQWKKFKGIMGVFFSRKKTFSRWCNVESESHKT